MNDLLKPLKKLARKTIDLARVGLVDARYKSAAIGIRKSIAAGNPVDVFFVVTQKQLWGVQSVYDEFRTDSRFVPIVIAMPNTEDESGDQETTARENLRFFENRGMNAILGITQNGYVKPLSDFAHGPCLCFFDQPWTGLPAYWSIPELAQHALICYVPYGFKIANAYQLHFNLEIHNLAWRVFAETEWHKQQFVKLGLRKGSNVLMTGYPKFDEYRNLRARERNKVDDSAKSIIWAPHWSIRDKLLGYSTFDKYHEYFIHRTAAAEHLQWIFKPHQKLKYHAVDCGFMTPEEVDDYYRYWACSAHTKLYDDPGYIELFEDSSALITDSGSFLAEYLPTGKPVLLLASDASVGYNSFGKAIVDSYYKARSTNEIDEFIERVVLRGDDPLKARRHQMLSQVMASGPMSSGTLIKQQIETGLELNR